MTKPYTQTGCSQLENQIHQELTRCIDAIRTSLDVDLESILLIGGYGRGEGGVAQASDGSMAPKNNFDLMAVTKRRQKPARVRDLMRDLTDVTSINADLSVRTVRELQRARRSMLYFDARCASKTLWGRPATELISEEHLYPDAAEALRTLRNRSVLLLMARQLSTSDRMNLTWRSKAIIGYLDALAILKQRYVSSYSSKRDTIDDLAMDLVVNGNRDAGELDVDQVALLFKTALDVRMTDAPSELLVNDDALNTTLERLHLECFALASGHTNLDWADLPSLRLPLRSPFGSACSQARSVLRGIREPGIARVAPWPLGVNLEEASQKSLPFLLFDRPNEAVRKALEAFPALGKSGKDVDTVARRYIDIFNDVIA